MLFGNEFILFSKLLESESLSMTHSLFTVKLAWLPVNFHQFTMPLRCVHSCPKNFKTSHKASLTHHQAQCPAYVAQRTAADHLRATRSNKKQQIACNKLICHDCAIAHLSAWSNFFQAHRSDGMGESSAYVHMLAAASLGINLLSRQDASTADRPNKDGPCC